MRICIDSCVLICGLQERASDCGRLLELISPDVNVIIPRLIAQEVSRNLTSTAQRQAFYRLFYQRAFAVIVDLPIPRELVNKYVNLGLREKADAFIGAFAELAQVHYLISINRHFLKELAPSSFEVIDPRTFMKQWRQHPEL